MAARGARKRAGEGLRGIILSSQSLTLKSELLIMDAWMPVRSVSSNLFLVSEMTDGTG